MAAITTHPPHHPQLALPRRGSRPPSNPYNLRFTSSPSPMTLLLRRSRAAPLPHVAAREKDDDGDAIPDPEPRRKFPLGLPPLLVAAAASAALPRAALALSGGSCGGCDDSSSSSSSSSSSCDDSTSSIDWSSYSSAKKKKKEGAEGTHKSVGTAAAAPPVASGPDWWFWGTTAAMVSAGAVALYVAAKNGLLQGQTIAVVKLQVALRGTETAKSLQRDMNRIAETVKASNRGWYKFILTETTCSIYHNKDFVISSSLSVDLKDREGSWKEHFNKISMEERSKFDEETLSNLEGVKRRKTYSMKTDGSKNEYIVVTLLVAADETLNLPEAIRSAADLEAAVLRLNSTPESDLLGVQVLWTPQDEDDVLSEERMQKDYPYLKPLLRGDN